MMGGPGDRSSWNTTSAAQQGQEDYEETQNKTFCKWLNTRLEPAGKRPLVDLAKDFADGTRLIELLEVLTETSLGKYNNHPTYRLQKFENVNQALQHIKSEGVLLTNIGAEDIVDSNRKLVLGMIWKLLQRFLIAGINEEGSNAKEGLLLWVQKRTQPYHEVEVKNFTTSWTDGLALCALIHRHRPDLIDYDALSKDRSSASKNTLLAFQIAEESLGIPRLLDVEDLVGVRRPDEKSVMTYVAQYFHAFSSQAREETEANILTKFAETMASLLISIHNYEERARAFLEEVQLILTTWSTSPPTAPYSRLKQYQAAFLAHKEVRKRTLLKDKAEVTALLGNIQTKLRTYGLKIYEPEAGLTLADLDLKWRELLKAEAARSKTINTLIREMKEELRRAFANLANEFQKELQGLSTSLAGVNDPVLEDQLAAVQSLESHLERLRDSLPRIQASETECFECNVDENDYTVYSYDDLLFELDELQHNVRSRKSFIENQITARSYTNVTPEQLEEFESAFRSFDKDHSNTLDLDELLGALGSLGLSEKDTEKIQSQTERSGGAVTFDQFIKQLVAQTEDRLTAAKVRSTFEGVGANRGFVTDLDLRRLNLPISANKFFMEHLPEVEVTNLPEEEGRAYEYDSFLDQLLEEQYS